MEHYKKVLWSDELRFTLYRLDLVSAWRTNPDRMYCTNSEIRQRWSYVVGCFFWYDKRPFIVIPSILNDEMYCTILDNHTLLTLGQFYGMEPCYFQDDNATCRVMRASIGWYGNNGIQQLDWPM